MAEGGAAEGSQQLDDLLRVLSDNESGRHSHYKELLLRPRWQSGEAVVGQDD
jgi:hypothetical protein